MKKTKEKITVREMTLFSMFAALMLVSKLLMENLPNIHAVGMLTMVFTVVYRKKALIPLYIYIFLNGLVEGFSLWWIPYLYIWLVLWAMTMLIPKNIPEKWATPVYAAVCALHGISFGLLYAPCQAIMYHLNGKALLAWIISGLYFDLLHAGGNFCLGLLIYPLSRVLKKLEKMH